MITQDSKNVDELGNSLEKNSLGFVATILFLGYLFFGDNQLNQFEVILFGAVYIFVIMIAFSFDSFRKITKEYTKTVEKIEESRKNQEIELKRGLR
jgi:Ca2+/Na+ antiporter